MVLIMTQTIQTLSTWPEFDSHSKLLDMEIALADPRFGRVATLYDYWLKRRTAGIPDRRDIDPISLGAAILPYIVMIDILSERADYRWRLFGSAHEAEYGANLQGMVLSELSEANPSAHVFKAVLDRAVAMNGPLFFELAYSSRREVLRRAVGVLMPLRDGGGDPAILFGGADWI